MIATRRSKACVVNAFRWPDSRLLSTKSLNCLQQFCFVKHFYCLFLEMDADLNIISLFAMIADMIDFATSDDSHDRIAQPNIRVGR